MASLDVADVGSKPSDFVPDEYDKLDLVDTLEAETPGYIIAEYGDAVGHDLLAKLKHDVAVIEEKGNAIVEGLPKPEVGEMEDYWRFHHSDRGLFKKFVSLFPAMFIQLQIIREKNEEGRKDIRRAQRSIDLLEGLVHEKKSELSDMLWKAKFAKKSEEPPAKKQKEEYTPEEDLTDLIRELEEALESKENVKDGDVRFIYENNKRALVMKELVERYSYTETIGTVDIADVERFTKEIEKALALPF